MDSEKEDNIGWAFVEAIKRQGQVIQMLSELMDHELLQNLSKHNPFWDSEHELEDDKLHDIRCQLSFIHEKICDSWGKLKFPD